MLSEIEFIVAYLPRSAVRDNYALRYTERRRKGGLTSNDLCLFLDRAKLT